MLGSGGDLKRLQLTIRLIVARFVALIGIIVIQVFAEIFSKIILSILPYNYFAGIVESIVATYRIVMILLKDLLL